MFDPENYEAIESFTEADLASLPNAEDDRHEYKSSATRDPELAEKIARAASGFWNTGGGLFVAGVSGQGVPDGGVPLAVGRQSRRDWIDQAIARVAPRGRYAVRCIEGDATTAAIAPGSGVALIGFAASEVGPHMAPDNRYYIRAGAHTVPASHFLVEAIHARRGLRAPMLRHVVRRKPEGAGVLQVGILCLNEAPALDVKIRLDPIPQWLESWGNRWPLVVPVVSSDAPFYFDFHLMTLGNDRRPSFNVELSYSDLADRQHRTILAVDGESQIGPNLGMGAAGIDKFRDVERATNGVAEAIKSKRLK